MAGRNAREILNAFDYKSKFIYQPDMELTVPITDRKGSMDKISFSIRNEETTLSDLFIAYAVSLYQFTIPPVIAATIQVFGRLWPEKYIPKHATRDELLNRIKKLCGMGFLRRYTYVVEEQNIVLYATTVDANKIIYRLLKYKTDARAEKDLKPPIEVVADAAASLVVSELLQSEYLTDFRFMPAFTYQDERHTFYAEITHDCRGYKSLTIIQPVFIKVDTKRYTEQEWLAYQKNRVCALHHYMELRKKEIPIQLILVLQDMPDFVTVSTWVINEFPQSFLESIYFTSEGSLKSGAGLKDSLLRISKITFDETTHQNKGSAITNKLLREFF